MNCFPNVFLEPNPLPEFFITTNLAAIKEASDMKKTKVLNSDISARPPRSQNGVSKILGINLSIGVVAKGHAPVCL